MKRQLLWFCLLGILPLAVNASAYQGEGDILKKKLCKGWKYEKCRIMGVDYAPKQEEANDQFQFHQDMTFSLTEEGEVKSGKWKVLDEEAKLISLEFDNGTVKQLKVEQINKDLLVYTIVADWQYDVTIYMQAHGQAELMQANGMSNFIGIPGNASGVSLKSLLFP